MKLINKFPNGDVVVIDVPEDIAENLLENYPEKFEIFEEETNGEEQPKETAKKRGRPKLNENSGDSIEDKDQT